MKPLHIFNWVFLLTCGVGVGGGSSYADEPRLQEGTVRPDANSYHIICTVDTTTKGDKGSDDRVVRRLEIWYDSNGNRQRVDCTFLDGSSDAVAVGRRDTVCANCTPDGRVITATKGAKNVVPVEFRDAKKYRNTFFFNWVRLGLLNDDVAVYGQKEWNQSYGLFAKPNSEIFLPANIVANQHTQVITLQRRDGEGYIECEVMPSKNNNPVRYTYKMFDPKTKKEVFVSETRIELLTHRARNSAIQFPRKVFHERSFGDHKVIEESIDVATFEANIDIPGRVFSLEGMDLDNGTPVNIAGERDLAKAPTWQNGGIDKNATVSSMMPAPITAEPVPDVRPRSFWDRSWPYLVGATLLAGVGLLLLRNMKRRTV